MANGMDGQVPEVENGRGQRGVEAPTMIMEDALEGGEDAKGRLRSGKNVAHQGILLGDGHCLSAYYVVMTRGQFLPFPIEWDDSFPICRTKQAMDMTLPHGQFNPVTEKKIFSQGQGVHHTPEGFAVFHFALPE
ncbi:hypothetical protein NDU88_006931 [Pleurodeles waltl]|uniref:Uncharacterized protein n=1 Tax=Pleurodeles waltl TaxID=8319 RepID=A0AAV7QMI2_PLEWA|nr:hypothetical protein NDU88_006931 [Pleurodeles waltl]